jgi:hypothetical protein
MLDALFTLSPVGLHMLDTDLWVVAMIVSLLSTESLLYRSVRRLLCPYRRSCCDGRPPRMPSPLALRHENTVLRRQLNSPVRHEPADRFWLAALSSLIPRHRWSTVSPVTPGHSSPDTADSWQGSGTTPRAASGAAPRGPLIKTSAAGRARPGQHTLADPAPRPLTSVSTQLKGMTGHPGSATGRPRLPIRRFCPVCVLE